ncbi:MAG: hypothetical protein OXG05_04815 [Gammaproteobacteria bacterium]|nr:hypothetical protein [Gammaproteobacteria bacterium]
MQERTNVIRSVFTEWTVGDLEDALEALENLPEAYKYAATSAIIWRSDFLTHDQRIQLAERIGPNDPWIHGTVTSIRAEAASTDPRSAFYDHLSDKVHSQRNYAELYGIVTHWIERDGVAILREIHDALDNADARRSVMQGLIWNAITTKSATPIEVLNVLSDLPNNRDARQTLEHLFRSWASLEPKQSFEASLKFADKRLTHQFRSSLLRTWASKDAEGLLSEVSSLPSEYRNTAVINSLGKMSRDDPEAATRYARNLGSLGLRSQAREAIIREWSEVDAKSAFEWFMNDSFNDEAKENYSIFWRAFSSYLDQNFESAERYADEYQGEFKNRLIEAVARYLSDRDPDRAIEYLPKVRRSARGSLRFSIGMEIAESRPIEALEYGETLHEERHDQYYNQLLGKWARRDFFSLHENIRRVPSAYQGHAARYLLGVNEDKSYLSAREVRTLEDIVATAPPIVPRGE